MTCTFPAKTATPFPPATNQLHIDFVIFHNLTNIWAALTFEASCPHTMTLLIPSPQVVLTRDTFRDALIQFLYPFDIVHCIAPKHTTLCAWRLSCLTRTACYGQLG